MTARQLIVTIDLDWGEENDLWLLREPLMDWVMEQGRIDDHRFKFGVATSIIDTPEDA